MKLELTAVFRKVPEGYIGFVEELQGANTQGATLKEARSNLREAVLLILEANRALTEEELEGHGSHSGIPRDLPGLKRFDLIRHLVAAGCELLRDGARHSVYVNRATRKTTTVPRHRELNEFLARKICRDLEIPEP